VAFVGEYLLKQSADAQFVVDYKNDGHGCSVRAALRGGRGGRGTSGRRELRK
jgi:hypothetical protein